MHPTLAIRNHAALLSACILMCPAPTLGAIVPTGDVTPVYNGADDPWDTGSGVKVGYSNNGALLIDSGSIVNSDSGSLGITYNVVGHTVVKVEGEVTVTGAGSTWNSSGGIAAGSSGIGIITIADGGVINSEYGVFGANDSGSGTVTVSGVGSAWQMSGDLKIGPKGAGALRIDTGGSVYSNRGFIGRSVGPSRPPPTSMVTVTGTGSHWQSEGILHVGMMGPAVLNIEDGGEVTADYLELGRFTTGGSVVNFDDGRLNTGTLLASATELTGVGTINTASLISDVDLAFDAEHGHQQTIHMADEAGLDITINLSVPDSVYTHAIGAGYRGSGTLRVADGFTLESRSGYLGYHEGSHGSAVVSGTGTVWDMSSSLGIGLKGRGELRIEDGAVVTAGYSGGVGGENAGAVGTLTVTGSGSVLNQSQQWGDQFYVGSYGSGTALVQDGGVVNSRGLRIAKQEGASGEVTITGPGSAWQMDGYLDVGVRGTGKLTISNGGRATSLYGHVGGQGEGVATVTGPGSSWEITSKLTVGHREVGTLIIEDGGYLSSSVEATISFNASGSVMVTGPGSTWINDGDLYVGLSRDGWLHIADGGVVRNNNSQIAFGSDSEVVVSGKGSAWYNLGGMIIGDATYSNGVVSLIDGGTLYAGDDIVLGHQYSTSGGTINLAGGVLGLNGHNMAVDAGSATFNFTGGLLVGAKEIDLGHGVDQQGGVFSPGVSIGQTDIVGSYSLTGGMVEIEVGGIGSEHDMLTATGDIDISLLGTTLGLPGIGPMAAGTYTVIESTGGTLAGEFEHVTGIGMYAGLVDVQYTANAVTITLNWDYVPGDLDGDGFVWITDLNLVLENWNQSVAPADLSAGDVTGDGFVGIGDLNAVLGNWNAGIPVPPEVLARVPEPGAAGVMLVGLGALMRRRSPGGTRG